MEGVSQKGGVYFEKEDSILEALFLSVKLFPEMLIFTKATIFIFTPQ